MVRPSWLAGRTTGDLLILIITGIIGSAILVAEVFIGVLALFRPGSDTSVAAAAISSVINVLIGLLAGFLAGRTDAHLVISKDRVEVKRTSRPEQEEGAQGSAPLDHE